MSDQIVSLFSGAMGLDLGLEEAGLDTAVCVEWDRLCGETIRANRPNLPLIQDDIGVTDTAQILKAGGLRPGEVFAVVGGPPCQPFSSGGLRQTIRERRGSLYADFVRIVDEARPRYFVFENVSQILSAAVKHRPIKERPGQSWNLSAYSKPTGRLRGEDEQALAREELAGSALDVILDAFDELGYSLRFGLLNAADYGAAQIRLRFVIIGSRDHGVGDLPRPTHSSEPASELPPWRTLCTALADLDDPAPEHSEYTERFAHYFSLIPPGGNWRDLPPALQKEALGEKAYQAGGGKTGFFRRLHWDAPTPTIVGKPNRKSSAICHPDKIRPLSVRECARVQGFPDQWAFSGAMHAKYLQVGNAVPVHLGAALGRTLLELGQAGAGRGDLHAWREDRDNMIEAAKQVFRVASRNKRSRKKAAMDALQETLL